LNIVFFQYGDFGEAYRRLEQGGPEYFRDQKYSVDLVASFRTHHRICTVAICDRPHRETLAENLTSIGISPAQAYTSGWVRQLLTDLAPDVIVLRTPHTEVLQWARKRRVPTLPLFADFIERPHNLRSLFRTIRLGLTLKDAVFPAISNHSLNASLSLVRNLRLKPSRVVPWDRMLPAVDPAPKTTVPGPGRAAAFFAGTLSQDKGVGDCLDAMHLLKTRNVQLNMRFAGAGDTGLWTAHAQRLGIADQVVFAGTLSNLAVRQEMRASDLVIVPSRHSYAEGLPNTLCEGLASQTPVICSDHPAFASRLRHGSDVVMFKAGSPSALADAVQDLISDAALYASLSANAAQACHSLFFGTDWGDLVKLFLNDPANRTGWVADCSLEKLLRDKTLSDAGR
jgi:glycosyltransferase involved in cell wall biosynthesis